MEFEDFVEHVASTYLCEVQDGNSCISIPHDIQRLIRATMKETAKDCILQLQLKILRNGDTPGNRRSWSHIDDIS